MLSCENKRREKNSSKKNLFCKLILFCELCQIFSTLVVYIL